LLCLPEILRDKGYHSYNIISGDPYFASQLPFMKSNGMDEVYGALEMKEVLRENPYGSVFDETAYSDNQVAKFMIMGLQKRQFVEPFTITVSTTDLHFPFRMPKDSEKFPMEENPIINLVRNVDAVFGKFMEYYKKSEYSSNTIIVMTADHAFFPGVTYQKLTKNRNPGFYDEIPFIIYDPTHKLPKMLIMNSSSVDITPSILHLLDINIPNPFEGMSVFENNGRPAHQNLLGSHDYNFFYKVSDTITYFNRDDILCNDKDGNSDPAANSVFNQCDYLYWWKYKKWLVTNNLVWKVK